MNAKEYQEFCKKTAKSYEDKQKEIFHWGLGLAGEAGDVVGCIKKVHGHDNEAILPGIKENIGDMMWYVAMICNFYGWDLEDVLQENVDKLKKRFPDGFKLDAAQRKGTKVDWNEK